MNVKLVLLAFAAVIYQANGQFSFGNGGFGQGGGFGGLFNLPSFLSMFRPNTVPIRPPQINIPTFGSNQGIAPLFFPFLSQFRPRPPQVNYPTYEPVNPPILPPTDLDDVHPPEYVSPEEIENERPTFPQSRPDSVEVSEPVAIVEIEQPGVSEEVIVAVPVAPQQEPISEENLFQVPEEELANASEENLFEIPEEEDIQDSQDVVDVNEIQQPLVVPPSVEIEEELPQEIPEEFIR